MRIAFANDHAAFSERVPILAHLRELGHEVLDFGTDSPESVDYPMQVVPAVQALLSGQADRMVVMCGSGIGISIAANRHPGVRCALCTDEFGARMCRMHNNANALALRAREQDPALNLRILDTWLTTGYEGGRHERRVKQLDELPAKFGCDCGCGCE